ncbi:hypothetical protein HQ563_01870 [bacterium]|nr:hypothetical protein [bacterium]
MKPIRLLAYVGGLGPFCRDMKGVQYDGSIRIADLQDLVSKLENEVKPHKSFCDNWFFDCSPIAAGQISKLGILAHGDVAGVVHIDGKHKPPMKTNNLAQYKAAWQRIAKFTGKEAMIIFHSCISAVGSDGSSLLTGISNILPGRTIVGFTTIGYIWWSDGKRTGETCVEVFRMKDTDVKGNLGDSFFRKRYREYLVQVPSSPHAKWARDGKIIRWPREERPACLKERSDGAPRINCPSKRRTIVHQPSEL